MSADTMIVWEAATERLRTDPSFAPIVERVGPVQLRPSRGSAFASLAASIVYQQLAGRAAQTIHGRFVAALEGDVTAERVLATPEATLRATGLSGAKLAAIRDLAGRSASGDVPLDNLADLSDADVIDRLIRVRGVGAWTAQMFLMFELHRPDVWPTGDLGVRNGLGRALGLASAPQPKEMEWIGVGYRPWRSAVAWYCWRALEA
jgi:DNA-3-methyladenine glycosylase II